MAKSSKSPTTAPASEEAKFLGAIAADLNDEAARLVYADWLEEQGDPRAKYVRDLATAVRTLSPSMALPKSKHPVAWTNLLGVPLFQGLIAAEITDLKVPLMRLARSAVAITSKRKKDSAIPIGASKFKGDADLPKAVEWPRWEQGPLGFLCQINLAELQGTPAASALPESGLLSFFAYQNYGDGYQPGQGQIGCGDTQVLYSPASTRLVRRKRPVDDEDDFDDEEANGPDPSCEASLVPTWDLPYYKDTVPSHLADDLARFASDKLSDKLHDIRRACIGFGHHLLGYPVHFRTDDPTPDAEWSHLLCLDSDDKVGWSWCDGEHLAVFVKQGQIANRSFAGAYGYAS